MKIAAAFAVLAMLSTAFIPLGASDPAREPSMATVRFTEGGATARAEPNITGTGSHDRTAVYDFSNTFIFNRWSVVMEPGSATLMKSVTFTNDTWSSRAPITTLNERAWHTAVYDTTDNIVIVQGGFYAKGATTVYSQPIFTYDPATDLWTNRGPSMLPQGAAGVWDSDRKCLIVCGGNEYIAGCATYHADAWAWFPANTTWMKLANMPENRTGQSAVYDPVDKKTIVFGGTNGTAHYNDLWSYDFLANTWTVINPGGDEKPIIRAYASAVWNPNKKEMVIHGGENATITFLSTWCYSFENNTWIHRTSAPFARSMHAAAWDSNASVMTVFGSGGMGNNDSWTYDPVSDSWGPNARMPAPARTGAAGVYDPVRKQMLVIGGRDGAFNYLGDNWAFKLGVMTTGYYPSGWMMPPVGDLGTDIIKMGNVSWTGNFPPGTGVSLSFRACNNNISWGNYITVAQGSVPSVWGRYIQWNMSLTASPDLMVAPTITKLQFGFTVNRRPACLAGDNLTGFKHEAVQLTGNGTDADGDTLTYKWVKLTAFDGTLDDAGIKAPAYTPLTTGLHTIQLIVNDSFSDSIASTVNISVSNRAPAVSAGPEKIGYKKEPLILEGNVSDPDGDAVFVNWSQTAGPIVLIVNYTKPNATITPSRAGNYTFKLKASDTEAENFALVNITVLNRGPLAKLEAAPASVNINGTVNFSAFNSTDSDGNLTKYNIDFGDGASTGWTQYAVAGHIYTRAGTYNASVRVMDDDDTVSVPSPAFRITVENARPLLCATVTPGKGDITTGFRFTVSPSSVDPDGKIVSYEWVFGDGATGNGPSSTHTYAKAGNYTVILRGTDDLGGVGETTLTVVVGNRAPVISTTTPAKSYTMKASSTTNFAVTATDPDGATLLYVWKVDGQVVGQNSSAFAYKPAAEGVHTVSVMVSDGGEDMSYDWSVTVSKKNAPVVSPGIDPMMIVGVLAVIGLVAGVAVALVFGRKKAETSRAKSIDQLDGGSRPFVQAAQAPEAGPPVPAQSEEPAPQTEDQSSPSEPRRSGDDAEVIPEAPAYKY